MNKDLVCKKEEIKFNSIIKTIQKCLTKEDIVDISYLYSCSYGINKYMINNN